MRGIVFVLALASGCVAANDKFVPHNPAQKRVEADPASAYGKAVRALMEAGYTIDQKDETAGVVMTAWESIKANPMGPPYRFRWFVTVQDGVATITSQCERQFEAGAPWEKCGDLQPKHRNDKALELASKM